MPPRPDPPPTHGTDARDAVEAVLRDQQDRARRRAAATPEPPADRTGLKLALVGVLTVLVVWIVVAPPSLVRPAPFPEPEPVEIEAGLRMDVFVAATAVARHVERTGRLPGSLADVLEDADDGAFVAYEPLPNGRWRVVGRRDGFEVVYVSTEHRNTILDPARVVLDGGG